MTKEELYSAWYEMNSLQLSSHPLVTCEIKERAKKAWSKLQDMFVDETNEATTETRKLISLLETVEDTLKDLK